MRCNTLRLLAQAGEIAGYESQVTFELKVNDVLVCRHIVDFAVYEKDKKNISWVEDVKGMETADWRLKAYLFVALHPEIPYHVKKASTTQVLVMKNGLIKREALWPTG